jgi:hypothetical protein
MRVYVAYTDNGCEGCSEPLAVFNDHKLVEAYLAGYKQSYCSGMKIKAMDINETSSQQGESK